MASTFTWLDYSEQERRKMLDVIEMFGERSTRDELGLGGIRDAFADLLFPGTSTIQTRARYFLFVPWIYMILESKKTHSASIGLKARAMETKLIHSLAASEDKAGIIGGRAKENLHRLPSSIYWQGLGAWGIRLFQGPQDSYHRSVDGYYMQRNTLRPSRHEFDGESMSNPTLANWHSGLPSKPSDFPDTASFSLKPQEAEYLRERILGHYPKSLLALIVRDRVKVDGVVYSWELLAKPLPSYIREPLQHGYNFSQAIHGAQLLYNLMLAELRKWVDRIENYQERLNEWWESISDRWDALKHWDMSRFWQIVIESNPRVSLRAKRFVNEWVGGIQKITRLSDIQKSEQMRNIIKSREIQLKGGLARLHNQRALELWPGAAGDGQLDLRWGSAKSIFSDIISGLENTSRA